MFHSKTGQKMSTLFHTEMLICKSYFRLREAKSLSCKFGEWPKEMNAKHFLFTCIIIIYTYATRSQLNDKGLNV